MNDLYPVVGVIFVAAITPGPNNILVLEASVRGGTKSAASVITGVVLGSLAVFFLILIGLMKMMEAVPLTANVIAVLGSLYLIYMGIGLFRFAGLKQDQPKAQALPDGTIGIIFFQFVNPKTWVLLSTVISNTSHSIKWSSTAIILIVVTTLCLMVWAIIGTVLSSALRNSTTQKVFEKVMALSLVLLAAGILFKAGAGF